MTRTTTQQRASVARMGRAEAASAVLAALAVLVQMVFPFTDGGTPALTTASVVLLSGAALAHAGVDPMSRGEALGVEQFARIAEGLHRADAGQR